MVREDERVKRQAFKTLLPLYSLKAAAGYFGNTEPVEPEGWMEAGGVGRLDGRMFVCRAVGRSMEPRIHDGDYVVFRAKPSGTRQGKIVLVQYRGDADPDTGGSYTIKRYSSKKDESPNCLQCMAIACWATGDNGAAIDIQEHSRTKDGRWQANGPRSRAAPGTWTWSRRTSEGTWTLHPSTSAAHRPSSAIGKATAQDMTRNPSAGESQCIR